MSARLKLLMILLWFVAFSTTAVAQSAEEDDAQTVFKKLFGGIEVSCETLLIAEYEGDEFLGQGKPRIIAFDMVECARQLASTEFSAFLQPLFDNLALMNADQEQRAEKIDEQTAIMQDELQKNIKPLISHCRALGEKHNGELNRVCFFGAPRISSGRPFQALFQAMVENTQPPYETLCTPDPIQRAKSTAPEFLGFLGTDEQTLSWTEVQKSLLQDKFECHGEGDFGGCRRRLMALAIAPKREKVEGTYSEFLDSKDGAAIIPRELHVYRGNQRAVGLPVPCFPDGGGNCGPPRGSKSGICSAVEDWHTWGRMMYLLNRYEDGG